MYGRGSVVAVAYRRDRLGRFDGRRVDGLADRHGLVGGEWQRRGLRRSRHGKAFTIIAVSEGAKGRGGQQVVGRVVADSPDPIRLGGISTVLCEQIEERTGLECRATILGHVQRGGTPVAADRVLGTLFGHKAIELALQGRFGQLVVMQKMQVTSVPLADVAGKQRTVPTDHPLIAAARGVGTCFGDEG